MSQLRTASDIRKEQGIRPEDVISYSTLDAVEVAINTARRELLDYLTYRENENELMRISKMKYSEIDNLKSSLK